LFHESDGFRGCFALVQQGPEVVSPWDGSEFSSPKLSKLAASHQHGRYRLSSLAHHFYRHQGSKMEATVHLGPTWSHSYLTDRLPQRTSGVSLENNQYRSLSQQEAAPVEFLGNLDQRGATSSNQIAPALSQNDVPLRRKRLAHFNLSESRSPWAFQACLCNCRF
jgi:hypothetical protein